ncbi:hypothetical protein TGMAS_416570 [Toxoplasma gondii MAS]|uniref:Uncharacterized protein n=1 Tax=Toxoplasma gondii MAS TaxID=943118 RepID=A0A086PVD5_TOXGO|nr:hypothetical protein TGMAS_416570 [Toxoplasma gondii MAS]
MAAIEDTKRAGKNSLKASTIVWPRKRRRRESEGVELPATALSLSHYSRTGPCWVLNLSENHTRREVRISPFSHRKNKERDRRWPNRGAEDEKNDGGAGKRYAETPRPTKQRAEEEKERDMAAGEVSRGSPKALLSPGDRDAGYDTLGEKKRTVSCLLQRRPANTGRRAETTQEPFFLRFEVGYV